MEVRRILNRITWDRRLKPEDYTITYIHRGGEEDKKMIRFMNISKVGASWFLHSEAGEETLIPFHRILEIRNQTTGEVLWVKREASN